MNIQDQKQVAEGKEIKFGLGQLSNPTPSVVTKIHRIFLGLIAVYGAFVLQTGHEFIPDATQAVINKWMLLAPFVSQALKLCFGWDFPNYKK